MRRIITVGVILFVLLLSIILVAGRKGSKSGNGSKSGADKAPASLVDYANTSTTVRFTQAGRINARENHRVLVITVGQTERTATIFEGYQGKVVKSETYLNDPDAYRSFLAALQNNGYTRSRKVNSATNPLGACSSGRRFNYDILRYDETKQSLWSTSCDNRGTFGGKANTVRTLFEQQLPDYNGFVKGMRL